MDASARHVEGRPFRGTATVNLLLLVAAIACLLDGLTTWVALNTGRFHEQNEAAAVLMRHFGVATGMAVSILLRLAIFAAIGVAIERFTRGRLALFAIGLAAAAITWLIVLSNIAALAR